MEILSALILGLLLIAAWKANEANTRLKVLDMRMRVMERFILYPKGVKDLYKEYYDSVFGAEEIDTYNKILKFGRRNNLTLPILTIEEEKEYIKNKKEAETAKSWEVSELP